jgi:Leucine-rich repeat (LRR) protein
MFLFHHLYELEVLDLSDNFISGQVSKQDYFNLVNLRHVDLSGNELTGVADILLSPSIRYLNYSQNIFSSVGYTIKGYAAYESIEVVDLSDNRLELSASAVFQDLPPNLKSLYISNNLITGTLPQPFPVVTRMEHFHASNNRLQGPLIEFSRSMPRVFTVDLSNQKHSESRGLDGPLPSDLPSLLDLLEFKLSGNNLTSTIPDGIGNIPRLQTLNLSDNALSGEIPSKLGQLAGECLQL